MQRYADQIQIQKSKGYQKNKNMYKVCIKESEKRNSNSEFVIERLKECDCAWENVIRI